MERFSLKTGLLLAFAIVILAATAGLILAQDTPTQDPIDVTALLDARGLTVRPLEDVTDSAEQILDLTDTSARLNFVGTIPLACTLLYGTTTDFGSATVDPNMSGAAIVEHNPIMLDLEPDTEYFYRVQGSAEDGTFYVGEIRSFRTEPADTTASDNLLSPDNGAQVTGFSSVFGDGPVDGRWGVLNAFDGNLNTAWATDGDGDDAWFEVQLGGRSRITEIEFQTRLMSDGSSQIFAFTVTTDSGDVYGPYDLPDQQQSVVFDVDFEAETLRFDVVASSGGNTGIDEVIVRGEPVGNS